MSRQAATPPLHIPSTEARADAEPSISANADHLNSFPRRLQRHSKSWLQCWVIVNSTGGKSCTKDFALSFKQTNSFYNRTCWCSLVFSRSRLPVRTSPPAPVLIPVSSYSAVFHGSSPTVPRRPRKASTVSLVQIPWSPHSLSGLPRNSHGPSVDAILHSPRSCSTARHSPVSRASRHLTSSPKNSRVPLLVLFVVRPIIIKSPTGFVFASRLPLGCLGRSWWYSTVRVFPSTLPVFILFVS